MQANDKRVSLWTSGIVSDKSKLVVNECVPQSMGNMTEEKRKKMCVLNEHDYIRMSILGMTGSGNKTGAYCIVYNMYILTSNTYSCCISCKFDIFNFELNGMISASV